MQIPTDALALAGFALAHAAWSVSDVAPGELLAPFLLTEAGAERRLTRFEAETQDAAIERGTNEKNAATDTVDAWAFAREGLISQGGATADVLAIEFWARGMSEPLLLLHRFEPVQRQTPFRLAGATQLVVSGRIQDRDSAGLVLDEVTAGVQSHPKAASLWTQWNS